MRRALITGAAGRLGREVVARFNAEGIDVTALVLTDSDLVDADRVVVGDAREIRVVRDALREVDVVVHLAALPSPHAGTPEEVFCNNTAATFTVLEQAAAMGVRRAVIASSQAISGRPFGPQHRQPAYLPVDEATPLHVADPYALSKLTDEATAAMMWWRHGLSVCALRFPFLGAAETRQAGLGAAETRQAGLGAAETRQAGLGAAETRQAGLGEAHPTLRRLGQRLCADPALGVDELWAYLDLRDAARACLLAARQPPNGTDIVLVAAPRTIVPYGTESLLDKYLPDVPRRRHLTENEVPIDLSRSKQLLGFEAEHIWTS